jgi:hypothetical protein
MTLCYVKAMISQRDTTFLANTYSYYFYCKLQKKKLQNKIEFCTTGILGNRLQIQRGSRLPTGWFLMYKFNDKVSSTKVLSPTEYNMAHETST